MLYQIARIPMVIVKPLKLYMFYYIFIALFPVLISMPIFTFKVGWEIPYGEAFHLQKPSLELMTNEKKSPTNDTRLELPGYNLFRSHHPSNNKRDVYIGFP